MHALKTGHTLGQYEILRLLGEGGMGAVYEARHTSLERRVAIKTLHANIASNQIALQRFFAEAKTLSRLEHHSIVQVSDFGTSPDGTVYLVMEYLRGDSLGKRLRKIHDQGQSFAPIHALQICWQVAEVLTIAHSKGIIHRDIKPDNLMLVADSVAPSGERVKVLDFGIAKLSGEFERAVAKTDTNALMGTPMYMSPEQCAGAGKVDDRTDVYALGCVLFQMLAGRPPFYAEGAGELIGMHLFQPPPSLLEICPTLPKPVAAIVARMLTKEKSQRPNMALIAEELRQLLSVQTGQSVLAPALLGTTGEDSTTGSAAVPITTFGQSTGQNIANQRRKKRSLLVVGVCVGLLLWVALWVQVKTSRTTGSKQSAATHAAQNVQQTPVLHDEPGSKKTEAKQSPPVSQITWQIDSQPSHASVLDERGNSVGETPWNLQQESAAGTATFHLKLTGFQDQQIQLDRSESKRVALILRPLVAVGLPGKRAKQPVRIKPEPKIKIPVASTQTAHASRPEIRYEE